MAKSRIKRVLIVLLNLVLYLIYGNKILFILIASVGTYFLSKKLEKNKNFYFICFVYLFLLMPLVFFKYIINMVNFNILVPLGISYYTLALISYISDVYNGKYKPAKNIIDFLLYSLYFPCLFIGPINRYNEFEKEIKKIKFKKENIYSSSLRICFGLIKKLIISNKLNIVIMTLSSNTDLGGLYVLFGCFMYTIILYCDFSGGIDIVMGISKLFNINLKENFDHPYLSESVKEFWRRWHITLGNWLKDYIYIPLGGNRVSSFSTKINVLVTFAISGVWHGLHYILWGILNGIMVILNFKTKNKYINIVITMIVISLLWIFFIYNHTFLSIEMFISIFKGSKIPFSIATFNLNIWDYLIIISSFIVVMIYENKKKFLMFNNYYIKFITIILLILIVLVFGNYGLDVNSKNFIYGGF